MSQVPKTDPNRDTRDRVAEMREQGLSVRRIALVLDVSTQRVYQILKELEPEERAS